MTGKLVGFYKRFVYKTCRLGADCVCVPARIGPPPRCGSKGPSSRRNGAVKGVLWPFPGRIDARPQDSYIRPSAIGPMSGMCHSTKSLAR